MRQLPAQAKAELLEEGDKLLARFAIDHQPVRPGAAKQERAKALARRDRLELFVIGDMQQDGVRQLQGTALTRPSVDGQRRSREVQDAPDGRSASAGSALASIRQRRPGGPSRP